MLGGHTALIALIHNNVLIHIYVYIYICAQQSSCTKVGYHPRLSSSPPPPPPPPYCKDPGASRPERSHAAL